MAATAARLPEETALDADPIRLRPVAAADAAEVDRLNAVDEPPYAVAGRPCPPGAAAAWIGEALAEAARGEATTFVLERIADGALLGALNLRFQPNPGEARIGYWVAQPYRRQGHAAQAIRRTLAYGFDDLELQSISASCLPDNTPSLALLERLGFVREKIGEDGAVILRRPRALPRLLVVAVALVDVDGRVLLAQRPEGKPMAGLWEFPGGKVGSDETLEQALIRELKEELGIDVKASCLAPFTFASHAYDRFHLLMPLYVCRRWNGTVTPQEGQRIAWVRPARLADYPMPPADKPLVAMLRDLL